MVEQSVVVAVEEGEVLLVLFLLFDGDVFLYFFLGVVVVLIDGSKEGHLLGGRHLGEVVSEIDLLASVVHQLHYDYTQSR